MQQAILLIDILSNRSAVLYGHKGEQVSIISWHGKVAIVEGKKGRFSVREENLQLTK